MMQQPQQAPQQAPQQGKQGVDPRSVAMFDKIGKMALKVLASEKGVDVIARDAQQNGPARAIASAVTSAVDAIVESARGARIEIPPEVIGEIKATIAKLLLAVMVQSGLAGDPRKVMQELQQLLAKPSGEPPPGQEQQPAGPPPGALAQARGAQ